MRCPSCHNDVPEANFCVVCGHELGKAVPGRHAFLTRIFGAPDDSLLAARRRFAANPREGVLRPSVVTSLFPQLPQSSTITFRISLVAGLAVVLALGLAKLFPIGLIAGAVLVPTLAILYFYDVDVYEDEPLRVVALTLLWGAATGIGWAFLVRAVSPTGARLFAETGGHQFLTRGIVLPLLSVALMLAGPLILLPYRRFNDALDGATFGAASAVAFTGGALIVHAFDTLADGLRPPGQVGPWVVKLANIAIALPVLSMATIGALAGAFWLRYRAPVRDRNALGRLGKPLFALPLACLLIAGGAVVQLELPILLALIVLLAMDAVALVWLRAVVHVGLLEEAVEADAYWPEITCANCGHRTHGHTFCEHCGVALAALPKPLRSSPPVSPVPPPEPAGG
jgi:RsiW-degrading membrane proteinase PrsW (M82 family)